MYLTNQIKTEIIERYWSEIVPKYLNHIEDTYDLENKKVTIEYNKLLPYLKKYILINIIDKCKKYENRFDPSKSKSGNPIFFFMTISKNYTITFIRMIKLFLGNITGTSSYLFSKSEPFQKVYKILKREYLIDQIVGDEVL
jgi:ribosomal protein S17E